MSSSVSVSARVEVLHFSKLPHVVPEKSAGQFVLELWTETNALLSFKDLVEKYKLLRPFEPDVCNYKSKAEMTCYKEAKALQVELVKSVLISAQQVESYIQGLEEQKLRDEQRVIKDRDVAAAAEAVVSADARAQQAMAAIRSEEQQIKTISNAFAMLLDDDTRFQSLLR